MKRLKILFTLILISTLITSFSAQSQTVKRYTYICCTQVDDGLTSAEINELTNTGCYGTPTIVGTTLPAFDANCTGSVYACSLYILFPSGCNHSLAQILAAVKIYLTINGWPGCGTVFNVTVGSCTYTLKWFCKDSC